MSVFIINLGRKNYLWPECLDRSTIAITENDDTYKFWQAGDRAGYLAHTIANITTARGQAPKTPLASRWYNLLDIITRTQGDVWIHRQKDRLWWTVSRGDPAFEVRKPPRPFDRPGVGVVELHKPTHGWSDRTQNGTPLLWSELEPRAQRFLFSEITLQELKPSNAAYALALIDGADPSRCLLHKSQESLPAPANQKAPAERRASASTVDRMVRTVLDTVAHSNGQRVERFVKDKWCAFSAVELRTEIKRLIAEQDGRCKLTGIRLRYDGEPGDEACAYSLDRIDSNRHYEPGNLQIVCKFINSWKSDSQNEEFQRLLELVRSVKD